MCSVVADTTARKWAEQALRISQESAKDAQRVTGLGSFVFDVASRTWTASEVFYEILGIDRDCARCVAVWSDLIPDQNLHRLSALYGEVITGTSQRIDCETRFTHPAEKVLRWARVRGVLEKDAQGRPSKLRGTIEDITERKESQAKIDQSARLLQLFIQDTPAGVAMFDDRLRYMSASRRWVEERGMHVWEIAERSVYEVHPRLPEAWREDHRRALAVEMVQYREDRFENEEGRERWV